MPTAATPPLSGAPNLIPLHRTLAADTLTPVGILVAARRMGLKGFLLESVEGGRHLARYSILGFDPRERLVARDGRVFSQMKGQAERALEGALPDILKGPPRRLPGRGGSGLAQVRGRLRGLPGLRLRRRRGKTPGEGRPLRAPGCHPRTLRRSAGLRPRSAAR